MISFRFSALDRPRRAFAVHAAVYLAVNVLLVIVDLATGGGVWFPWPLLGWGIGVAYHGWVVFRRHGRRPAPERRG